MLVCSSSDGCPNKRNNSSPLGVNVVPHIYGTMETTRSNGATTTPPPHPHSILHIFSHPCLVFSFYFSSKSWFLPRCKMHFLDDCLAYVHVDASIYQYLPNMIRLRRKHDTIISKECCVPMSDQYPTSIRCVVLIGVQAPT